MRPGIILSLSLALHPGAGGIGADPSAHAAIAAASGRSEHPASPVVSYRIQARLHVGEHLLTGQTAIRYENRSDDVLGEVHLHLLANSYRDRFSTAGREKDFYHDRTIRGLSRGQRGYIDIEELTVDGVPVRFLILDTVLTVALPRPLAPGGVVSLDLRWLQRIRPLVEGGGHRGDHFVLTHWYPKVAVRDAHGWDDQPAHDVMGRANGGQLDGGRYGVFADYEVALTVPRDFVLAATGVLVAGDPGSDASTSQPVAASEGLTTTTTSKTVRFRANDVHDFAWVADRGLRVDTERVGPIRVQFLARPSSDGRNEPVLRRVSDVLRWMEQRLGAFPFPELTVVETVDGGVGGHPMLILVDGADERHLVRQIARMYVHATVSIDTLSEAWLGEGLASWYARRYLEQRHGRVGIGPDELDSYQRRLPRTSLHDRVENQVVATVRVRRDESVATPIHMFRDRELVVSTVRERASLLFDQLAWRLGEAELDRALTAVFRRHRLEHLDGARLCAGLEAASGVELAPVFEEWLHATGAADYQIRGVQSTRTEEGYRVSIGVGRRGGSAMPVDVLVRSRSGEERRVRWDGRSTIDEVVVTLADEPDRVWIDPDRVILDRDRFTNRWPRKFEWAYDWPLMDYEPSDAYMVRWRPAIWYDFADGVRGGARVEGEYPGGHRFHFEPTVDSKRARVDMSVGLRAPVHALGRTSVELDGLKAEGRRHLAATIHTNLSPRLERRPQSEVWFGLSSLDVSDLSYSRRNEFDLGTVNQLWFRYAGSYASAGWLGDATLEYHVAGPQLQSDFAYNRASLAASMETDVAGTRLQARTFVGLSSDGDRLPRQERFYLAGAGPMKTLPRAGLRSRDSLLTLINYHLPGEGNLRGYNDVPAVSARRLFSLNFEAERAFGGNEPGPWQRLIGRPSLALFADAAKAEGTGVTDLSNPLFGLGAGVRFERRLYGRDVTIRLDVPFYLNRPAFDRDGVREPRAAPRWILSFSPSFRETR